MGTKAQTRATAMARSFFLRVQSRAKDTAADLARSIKDKALIDASMIRERAKDQATDILVDARTQARAVPCQNAARPLKRARLSSSCPMSLRSSLLRGTPGERLLRVCAQSGAEGSSSVPGANNGPASARLRRSQPLLQMASPISH